MAAEEHLNSAQFFHGSRHTYAPGHVIDPSEQHYAPRSDYEGQRHVYFTKDPEAAHDFAAGGYGPLHDQDADPHVYSVKPLGDYEPDPEYKDNSFRTQHKVQVLGRN